ncbi:DUF6233 domain-containing protein [Streptomyces albiflavescens]|uniref:DUF6233 domain-containing protein n=1 Tax=Streptomyces albiflavescens TaxID=1623582 RepID=UPI00166C39B5|nr:DUF6233 domain-containing protein [Streptomyces albiflavescens]
MNDPLPLTRLDLLRFLERVQEQDLTRMRRWIEAEKQREAEGQRGFDARPPAPDWLIEQGLSGRDPVYVHVGGCWNAGKRSRGVERDQALRALVDGVPACTHCRPGSELGYLE